MAKSKEVKVDRKLVAAVQKVLAKFRTETHAFSGGDGVSCFVWINGRLSPLGGGENCIRLDGLETALLAVPGVHSVHINLD